jgi:hypothetical protein
MRHVTTNDLELYRLCQMTDSLAIAVVEEHILGCLDCADRLLAIGRFICLVRAGLVRAGTKGYEHFFISGFESDGGKDQDITDS